MKISQRVQNIAPSATIAMATKAKQMVKDGQDVISFALGEPDFPTPAHICEAADAAMAAGHTKYTAASGTDRLKNAIAAATERDLGLATKSTEVAISNGAKHTLTNVFATLLDPGDHVVLPAPYWVSYAELIGLFGGTWTEVAGSAERDFVPEISAIEAAITDKTVAILFNSPNNPSGAVWDPEVIEALADLAVRRDITIISDEIYKHIMYDGRKHASPAQYGDEARKRTLIVDGVAKTYAMTGWRIGWLVGPEDFVKATGKLQSQMTSCPNTIAMEAAADALDASQDCVEEMRAEFAKRRDLIVGLLNDIPGVECRTPGGAFYAFPDVSSYYGKTVGGCEITGSLAMCEYLLTNALISTVPGDAFGTDDFIRLSFACSDDEIIEGCKRLKDALAK
ncbi:MAG TPA: pyridoxal phosphate-dependent aminotransferase [Armatimonadota bacterium]|nr:pyridoxal phosphate-dependent aminotransferase [Armatimonadota bacterium]